MINREAILHIPKSNLSYAYDRERLHIRIRTKKDDIKSVWLRIGDPYDWEKGGLDGGNLSGDGAEGWLGAETIPMVKEAETEYFDYWFCEHTPIKKRSRYAFILESDDEKILFGEKKIVDLDGSLEDEKKLSDMRNFFCFPYLNGKDVLDAPKWAKNMVWYQIFPERFCNGKPEISPENVMPWGSKPERDNFMGGDLYGLYEKIDYLEELGVTGIYLCPIFHGISNHKYDTVSYFEIDPHFGDKEIFKKIVEKLHQKGMKIMLDAVFNHVGTQFPQWKDVVKNGKLSKYVDWFLIKKFPVDEIREDGKINYETFANTRMMPKLNLENPDCRKYMLEVASYWVKEFDIDGWRLDVSNEIDHKFWREFRELCKGIKKDIYILGEIWHNSLPWLMGDQFDAVMNYPMSDAIIDFLKDERLDGERLKYGVNDALIAYPKNISEVNFNLLDSHDTPRILTQLKDNKNRFKMAMALLFFQSGSPCIYYGTEYGMNGDKNSNSEDNRKCMVWNRDEQDEEIFKFVKQLIKIRKESVEFQFTDIEWLDLENSKIIGMKKGNIIFLINGNGEKKERVNLKRFINEDRVYDLFRDSLTLLNEGEIELLPEEFILMKI